MLSTQLRMFLNISLLLRLFSKAKSNKKKNSSLFAKKSTSPTLVPSIVLKKPSNLLFKLFGNYDKLKKEKPERHRHFGA